LDVSGSSSADDRVEPVLGRAERARGRRGDEGAHVLGVGGEDLVGVADGPGDAGLRDEAVVGLDHAPLVDGPARRDDRLALVLDVDRLEAEIELHRVGDGPRVLQVQLRGLRVERVLPLREERVLWKSRKDRVGAVDGSP
jgi:hypothetical protein